MVSSCNLMLVILEKLCTSKSVLEKNRVETRVARTCIKAREAVVSTTAVMISCPHPHSSGLDPHFQIQSDLHQQNHWCRSTLDPFGQWRPIHGQRNKSYLTSWRSMDYYSPKDATYALCGVAEAVARGAVSQETAGESGFSGDTAHQIPSLVPLFTASPSFFSLDLYQLQSWCKSEETHCRNLWMG